MRTYSADYAVARCPSVPPSDRLYVNVTRRYYIETAKHMVKLFFTLG